MRFIGITGGIGAGKSLILSYLKDNYSCEVVLADDVAKELMEPGTALNAQLQELFADVDVFEADGSIRKEAFSKVIFSNEELLAQMNALVHPAVKAEILRRKESAENLDYFFVEAALLIEDHYDEICDELWYIYASKETRRARLISSRGYSDAKVDSIFTEQLSEDEFFAHCDKVIDNNGLPEDAYRSIDLALAQI